MIQRVRNLHHFRAHHKIEIANGVVYMDGIVCNTCGRKFLSLGIKDVAVKAVKEKIAPLTLKIVLGFGIDPSFDILQKSYSFFFKYHYSKSSYFAV